jgi:protein TonB
MNPRALDEKSPGLSRRWGRPVLGSFAFHTLLAGAIVLALAQRISPHLSSGSHEAVMTLSLEKPLSVSAASPPAPARPVKIQSAPVPQKTAPAIEDGVPVLAAHPKPVLTPSLPIPPAPVAHAAPARHATTAKQVAAAAAAHVAPVATSYAPGEDVFSHPPYPEEARERGEIGTVKVNVSFDEQGRVAGVEITQSSGSLILDQDTAAFIRTNWHSAAEAGQVVSVPVRYSLENL